MDGGFKAPRLPQAALSSSSAGVKRKADADLPGRRSKQQAQSGQSSQQLSVSVSEDDDDAMAQVIADRHDFAPGGDADYFRDEDEDGRFFGTGLSDTQKQILEIFDDGDAGEGASNGSASTLTVPGVRRQLLNLERAINKNAELRVKWAGQPDKFVDSEVALDTAIQELLLLTSNPKAFYPELVRLGVTNSLADLLSHENIDISLSVINVLEELTDDDVAESADPDAAEDDDADASGGDGGARKAVADLADNLVKSQLVELTVNNLARMRENAEEAERAGVYHSLGLVENLLSLLPTLSSTIARTTSLVSWLLTRLQPPATRGKGGRGNGRTNGKSEGAESDAEDPATAQNRQYAAELLAILLQGDAGSEARISCLQSGGLQTLLKVLALFRKRDPSGADELEYMENLFDALCSLLSTDEAKTTFVEEEGTELMVIMLREKLLARARALKVLDYALSGNAGQAACEAFVEAQGLKSLFSAFMQTENKPGRKTNALTHADEERILGVTASLLSNLSSDSIPRVRLLRKFVEDDYAKVTRLLRIRSSLVSRSRKRELELASEKDILRREGLELDEVDVYLRRLDAGLYSLQLADYILAWLVMEDDGVRDHARSILSEAGCGFGDVMATLEEYHRNIGDVSAGKPDHGDRATDSEELRTIIEQLVQYVGSCRS